MNKLRVTLVTVYFYPEISPITHLYADLAADLVRCGAEVTVVTGPAVRGLSQQQRAEYRLRTDERTQEGYRILRTGGGSEGKNLLRRGLYLFLNTFRLYRAAKNVPTDVYLLGSMPPFLGVVGAKLHKRARTVYVLQDIFPDTVLLMDKFSEKHPVIRLSRRMERISYRGNTALVTISPDMAETLMSRGVERERVTVIENWADTDAVHPVSRAENRLFDELSIPRGRFIVLYAGVLGILQNPAILLDAAKRLADLSDVLIVIFGEGANRQLLETRIASEGIDNVMLLPLQPSERISEVYSAGDVTVVPLKRGVTRAAMPSKTWTAMAAGRPVIVTADDGSSWAETIVAADCGSVVPPEDADALADAIRALHARREELPRLGENARSYVQTHLSRQDATKRYFDVLNKER